MAQQRIIKPRLPLPQRRGLAGWGIGGTRPDGRYRQQSRFVSLRCDRRATAQDQRQENHEDWNHHSASKRLAATSAYCVQEGSAHLNPGVLAACRNPEGWNNLGFATLLAFTPCATKAIDSVRQGTKERTRSPSRYVCWRTDFTFTYA